MLRHPRKKRTIDKIIKIAHWEGFQDGICGAMRSMLEYASTSGWYSYNDVRKIAYDAGYQEAQMLLAEHGMKRQFGGTCPGVVAGGERRGYRNSLSWRYEIPAELYQQAYTMHHLFEASWRLRVERTT